QELRGLLRDLLGAFQLGLGKISGDARGLSALDLFLVDRKPGARKTFGIELQRAVGKYPADGAAQRQFQSQRRQVGVVGAVAVEQDDRWGARRGVESDGFPGADGRSKGYCCHVSVDIVRHLKTPGERL